MEKISYPPPRAGERFSSRIARLKLNAELKGAIVSWTLAERER
jgi:hypothetical protein